MIRRVAKQTVVICGILPFGIDSQDTVTKTTKTAKEADINDVQSETGWDRLYRMFSIDEFGVVSPEITSVLQVGCMSMFVGAAYGGFISSRNSYMEFMRTNQATSFQTPLEAKKKLQDQVTLGFGKGAFKWGWRLTYFCTTYVCITTAVSTYRGKCGIIEHMGAGFFAGATYKFNLGPRGWITGGVLGLVLGTMAGGITLGLLSLTGMSMEELRYWQYKWKQTRVQHYNKGIEKLLVERENFEILTKHDEKMGESGRNLDNVECNTESKK